MPFGNRDRDDFWDIASLLPQKRARRTGASGMGDTTPTTVESEREGGSTPVWRDTQLTVEINPNAPTAAAGPQPRERYTPTHSLIREVRIYESAAEGGYHELFLRTARQLHNAEGDEVPFVEFFSYLPQYQQMDSEQLAYYLWWRTCFRRGKAIRTTQSYLLLYLYEQINLTDCIEPREGQANMLRLWLAYRKEHSRIAILVREWLCDYSFCHHLPPPALPQAAYRELLADFRLKEFYVPSDSGSEALPAAVMLFCNNYDYTKSKFYTPENKEAFSRVMTGAVRVALGFLRDEGKGLLTGAGGISTMPRNAFAGAICSQKMRCRIEVDYTSFSHTHELRYIITDVLKYAENALRAALGIRSRLSIYAISVPLRERLDAYLPTVVPKKATRSGASAKPMPQYEQRYDLPVKPISLTNAAEIEAESWQTTRRLIEAFSDGENEQIPPTTVSETPPEAPTVPACATEQSAAEGGLAQALGNLLDFLLLAVKKDGAGQRAFARAYGEMPDAIADKINTVAGDFIGDILLEDCGGAFAVVEDYLDILKEEGIL